MSGKSGAEYWNFWNFGKFRGRRVSKYRITDVELLACWYFAFDFSRIIVGIVLAELLELELRSFNPCMRFELNSFIECSKLAKTLNYRVLILSKHLYWVVLKTNLEHSLNFCASLSFHIWEKKNDNTAYLCMVLSSSSKLYIVLLGLQLNFPAGSKINSVDRGGELKGLV